MLTRISTMERLRRLLDDGSELTLAQMKDALQLSERQVRRLLKGFEQSGIGVVSGSREGKKTFRLDEQDQRTSLPTLTATQAELRALTIAVKASQSLLNGTPHAEPLREVFSQLLAQVSPVAYVFDVEEQLQEWQFDHHVPDPIALDNFHRLDQAITERCAVRISYTTGSTQQTSTGRKIDPYFFAKRGRSWMLVGYCHLRKALRNFALNRIGEVKLCDPSKETAHFTIPEDFVAEEYFRGAFGAINSDTCYELRLLVEKDKAYAFRGRIYHATQLIEEERPDGRLIVSYELEGFEEMRSFCQSWGVGVTVLEPVELRARLYQEAQELVERYQDIS